MWPFIPWNEIDWSATIASCSALVATGALIWNVYWSQKQLKQAALTRIAESRLKWIDDFRDAVSDYIALMMAQAGKNWTNKEPVFDSEVTFKVTKRYHDIMMRLPAGQPHFDGFRETIYGAIDKLAKQTPQQTYEFAVDLEHAAIATIEAERAVAHVELSGGFK